MSILARSHFITLLSVPAVTMTALAGCAEVGPFRASGDDAVDPDAGIDGSLPPDASAACTVATNLAAVAVGTAQAPFVGDFFVVPTTGPQAGETVFTLVSTLSGGTTQVADLLVLEVLRRTGFQPGSPYPFNPDPSASYTAASYIISDYNFATMASGPTYWASSGSITFTSIGTTSGSAIRGTVGATAYREIDAANRDAPSGCRTNLMGASFNLTQE